MSGLTRRSFLAGAAGTAATLALAACTGDDDGGDQSLPSLTTSNPTPRLGADPFTLGVASGDPTPEAVILWTRLAPRALARNGAGGMPDTDVDVIWEIAEDADFRRIVNQGVETATPESGHAVHADATDLDPATDYRYRFRIGDFTSPVGRTRTLPEAGAAVDALTLAVVNCQWYDSGRYAAYRHLAEGPVVDLVVHLGDYIYEYASTNPAVRPRHETADLADYRLRYASYKLDPALQAAHLVAPFVSMWDDHEVINNYAGDTSQTLGRAATAERRAAAYQAWWEHLPVRFDPPTDGALVVYQSFDIGDLARLTMLDERQYSDVPPCRDEVVADFGDCAEREDDRTRLGDDQESWFADAVAADGVTWNLIGNPVVLAGVDAGTATGGSQYYLDVWDGYPAAQRRAIAALTDATNPVVLTGDYHAGMVLDVHETPFDPDSPVVAPEFMAPAISSVLFDGPVEARTPQLREQLNVNGYLTVEVEPEHLTARFLAVHDVMDPRSPVRERSVWVVDAGDPVTHPGLSA